jgi:hypothetical protein
VDEVDLALILAVAPPTHVGLVASDDHVDRPLSLLEGVVGVTRRRWRRQVVLIAAILRLRLVATSLITAVVITTATSIITTVVVVAS